MKFKEASEFIKTFGEVKGDLLEGCEKMQLMMSAAMDRDCNSNGVDAYEDWEEIWSYEVEAYNTVITEMAKLF